MLLCLCAASLLPSSGGIGRRCREADKRSAGVEIRHDQGAHPLRAAGAGLGQRHHDRQCDAGLHLGVTADVVGLEVEAVVDPLHGGGWVPRLLLLDPSAAYPQATLAAKTPHRQAWGENRRNHHRVEPQPADINDPDGVSKISGRAQSPINQHITDSTQASPLAVTGQSAGKSICSLALGSGRDGLSSAARSFGCLGATRPSVSLNRSSLSSTSNSRAVSMKRSRWGLIPRRGH